MNNKIISIVLLIAGLALLYWGYNMSQAATEQIKEAFTGSFSDKATLLMIGGGIMALVGLLKLGFGKKG